MGAEGTSYGIVPFMGKEQLAMVSALVGAGGNAGALFAGSAFYKQDWDDTLTPFKLHAGFVISMAILSPLFYWPEYGSMFTGPDPAVAGADTKATEKDAGSESTAPSNTNDAATAATARV